MAIGVLLLGLGLAGYGASRLARPDAADAASAPSVSLLLVQPSFPLHLKAEAQGDELSARKMMERQFALSAEGLLRHPEKRYVLWAETMVPGTLHFRASGEPESKGRDVLRWIADEVGRMAQAGSAEAKPLFMGGVVVRDADGGRRNAMLLLDHKGNIQARFDKMHLTPFGEYLPILGYLPTGMQEFVVRRIKEMSPFVPDLVPGTSPLIDLVSADGRTVRMGGLLCYEVAFAMHARDRTAEGAEFLFSPGNYGWYGRWMHPLTRDVARFRAAECDRTVVLATNDGPTAVIDPSGRVVASLPSGEQGSLGITVSARTGTTPYVLFGDVLSWICAALAALGWIAGFAGSKKPPGNLLTPSGGTA
jgi:apolipoprotein N-acyltransferase